jgi:uncharacterized Zn finger protein (UPF0148 family)
MLSKICPKCGKEIPEGSRYCNSCGYKIEPVEKPSILEDNKNKVDKQESLNDDSTKIKNDNTINDTTYEKQRRKLVKQIWILGITIFVVGFGGMIGYSYYNANKTTNVTMDATPVTDDTGTKFDITTNLPNGTNLMISISNDTTSYNAQDSSSVVQNGKVETTNFSDNNLQLPNGTYTIEITTPFDLDPSGSVVSAFGDVNKKLTGKYIVYDASHGTNTLDFKKDIAITDSTNNGSTDNSNTTTNTTQSTTPTDPTIGMTADQVRNSTWGNPESINRTTTAYSTSEQWVYSNNRYIYLDNGIVTTIQD